jgi:type II secretory pathway pseudopilin PulG
MIDAAPIRRATPTSEQGYMLISVVLLLALFTIALAVALPKASREIQRDRELETMQRGKQYVRGIKMYYKKFNAYPPNIDALVKTSEIRFLRKKYADPTTGKDEWNSIHFGQNKAPTAMGYFGKPLIGSTLAGIGVSGGNGVPGASNPGDGSIGSSTPASAFSGAGSFFGNASSSTDAGTAGTAGSTDSTSTSASGSNAGAQTFGGPGIIGFSPGSPKPSIRIYKTKNHYNQWEFVFDPLAEQMMGRVIPAKPSQPAASAFPSAFSSPAPTGN